MSRNLLALCIAGLIAVMASAPAAAQDLLDRIEHHEVSNDGVNIHYVTAGEGEVLLFVHGFPHFWYIWNEQMNALSDTYKTVAMDTRAANRSDQPDGVENYKLEYLMSDIDAVIEDLGVDQVTLVAHDWGGLVSWYYAMDERYRGKVQRLVMMNLTHPVTFARALAEGTDAQKEAVQYATDFQAPGLGPNIARFAERIAQSYVDQGEGAVAFVQAGYARSDFEKLLNYYRANFDIYWGLDDAELPKLDIPVLQFHGLTDRVIDKDGLNRTWDHISSDYTLVTYPDAGHDVQREAADRVTAMMRAWLAIN